MLRERSKTYTRIKLMVIDNVLRKVINVITKIVTLFLDLFPFLSIFGTFSTQCGVLEHMLPNIKYFIQAYQSTANGHSLAPKNKNI